MAPPPGSKPTSPYNFGLGSDFAIALVQPFLYFFSAILLNLPAAILSTHDSDLPPRVVSNPASVTEDASPNTCGLTQPDESFVSLSSPRVTGVGEKAAISLPLIVVICFASYYLDVKWHDPRAFHAFAFRAPGRSFLTNKLLTLGRIPPPDDYRVTQRREAMRLLFLVVVSAVLCPVADYLLYGPVGGKGAFVLSRFEAEAEGQGLWVYYFVGAVRYLFSYFGRSMLWGAQVAMMLLGMTLSCMATSAVSVVLAYATFRGRYGLVDIWDRRIERWEDAWAKEKRWAFEDEWEDIHTMEKNEAEKVHDEIRERNNELLFWRRGMREGSGYGPDYWSPRGKADTSVRQRVYKYSRNVGVDEGAHMYNPTASGVSTRTSGGCKGCVIG